MPSTVHRNSIIITVILVIAAGFALVPLWVPLVLAVWVSGSVRPLFERLQQRRLHARWAAALVTTAIVAGLFIPVLAVIASLTVQAVQLAQRLRQSQEPVDAIKALLSQTSSWAGTSWLRLEPEQARHWLTQHASEAVEAFATFAGAATHLAAGAVVFTTGIYVFLVRGRQMYAWFVDRSPLPRSHTERLGSAFIETGRGLLLGIGLTALLEGVMAGVGFLLIGIPQAPVLGLITALAAFVPVLGASIVWVPLAVGVTGAGRITPALFVVVIGVAITAVDNFIRPALSRFGKLELSTFTLFVAMLGGVGAFGPPGLLLGPLLVRLAAEALEILREQRSRTGGDDAQRAPTSE